MADFSTISPSSEPGRILYKNTLIIQAYRAIDKLTAESNHRAKKAVIRISAKGWDHRCVKQAPSSFCPNMADLRMNGAIKKLLRPAGPFYLQKKRVFMEETCFRQ
uniref:60S ribosomal protein L18 n=1 Tax=Angiostrongylus cantonensis TaxID=6313 RepID=A0A0K0DJG3_ANGCA